MDFQMLALERTIADEAQAEAASRLGLRDATSAPLDDSFLTYRASLARGRLG